MPDWNVCDSCQHKISAKTYDKVLHCRCDICAGFVLCEFCHESFSDMRKAKVVERFS